jgi:inositol phosphorylceramide synthase catalytic subunit
MIDLSGFKKWNAWWHGSTSWQRYGVGAFIALYIPTLIALDGLRADHIKASIVILILYYLGPVTSKLFKFLWPLLLTLIVYDSQRFYSDYIRGPVHVQEPYWFDKTFFGITTASGVLTPNEWWQLHTHPVFDFFCGLAYMIFVPVFVLCVAYFRFLPSQARNAMYAGRMMWGFFWLNMIGYSTYYWYAAAPPWYVALHGLGPAKMDTPSNVAGCARFDALMGTHFFTGFYGRSADVFGAVPSLHIAYPFLAVYYAFVLGGLRTFTVFFYVLMCFSAVYLNHHYILDILWGTCYAAIIGLGMDWLYRVKGWNQKT